jgi:hypothetical protein
MHLKFILKLVALAVACYLTWKATTWGFAATLAKLLGVHDPFPMGIDTGWLYRRIWYWALVAAAELIVVLLARRFMFVK